MKPTRFAAVVVGLVVSLTLVTSGASGQITPVTVAALKSWIEAVKTHTPGRVDAAVGSVAALSYKAREELNVGMEFFLHVLMGGIYDTKRNRAAQMVAELAHGAGNPDADSFLKQATVLHSDAAEYGDRFPVPSNGVPNATPPNSQKLQPGAGMGAMTIVPDKPVPPLLTTNRLVLHMDGQLLGDVVASWNWPFARRLLDLVGADKRALRQPQPRPDPFVGAWYHTTTAYMFASGSYGDATPHLQHATDILPDDARILFHRGCYAEILGLPMHQALLSERDVVGQRAGGRYFGGPPTWTDPGSAPALRIPSAEKTNAEAERLFRRALAIDPSLLEARVRLARLLDLRKRHEEAAAELKTVLAGNPRGVVGFYAHLFAGRVAQTMGRAGEASRHYQDALTLFPDAQSALLASSQVGLLGADVPAALAPVQRLGARSAVFTADPWWQYHLGAGRDAADLLKALRASVPR